MRGSSTGAGRVPRRPAEGVDVATRAIRQPSGAADEEGDAANAATAAVYKAQGEDDEDELLSVSASFNTLSLVHRDEGLMRFVKYVSHLAPSSRWDVAMQYTVEGIDDSDEEEDDDGGEEGGEGEELE